jgi:hypothetical protein
MKINEKKYICKYCGIKILPPIMHSPRVCTKCNLDRANEYYKQKNKKRYDENYHRDYQRMKRWLEGGPDNFLLGENIKVKLQSINGVLHVKI